MTTGKLLVEGMSCGHCVETIKKALGGLGGVSSVEVALEKKQVTVEYDDNKIELSAIASKINEAGFEVLS